MNPVYPLILTNVSSQIRPEQQIMEQRVVSRLERRIEEAIAETIMAMEPKRLPLLPSQQTMHLMAKAAVSVYEAVAQASGEHDEGAALN